jgi:hypothetical protein
MTCSGVIRVEFIVQWHTLLFNKDLLPDFHSIQESLWNVVGLLRRPPLAIIVIEVRGAEKADEWSTHCVGVQRGISF